MRDIRFRAWDKCTQTYWTWDEIFKREKDLTTLIKLNKKHNILEQYTGLKDKNGKEIYEGDIIYIAGVGDCTITFDGLAFEAVTPRGDIELLIEGIEDIEHVIGNIHQKPKA